jgi:hypothetical protein
VIEEHVGGRRWRLTGRRPRQTKEAVGLVLQRFLAEDSGSVAGLALRDEERMTSLSDRQREEMTHGAAAACVARRADVAASR